MANLLLFSVNRLNWNVSTSVTGPDEGVFEGQYFCPKEKAIFKIKVQGEVLGCTSECIPGTCNRVCSVTGSIVGCKKIPEDFCGPKRIEVISNWWHSPSRLEPKPGERDDATSKLIGEILAEAANAW